MMPKIRLTPEVGDNLSLTPPEPEGAPDTSVWAGDGAGGDETAIVPPVPVSPMLAWSVDEDDTAPSYRQSWASTWGRAAVMVALGGAVAVVIGILGWMAIDQDSPAPVYSPPSTMPAAALPPISTPVPTSTVTVQAAAPTQTWAAPKTSDPDVVPPTTTVTVQAAPPTPAFSGHYTMTDTAPDGQVVTVAWHVTSCGDGCVDIGGDDGRSYARQVQLVNGQWVFGVPIMAICADGSSVPHAGNGLFTIDASTLRGILQDSWTKERCGLPPGDTVTHSIGLTRA
jgi:hypothetical protein